MAVRVERWLRLGLAMRRLRNRAGWSLEATSRALGTTKGHLSLVERGVTRPSDELVSRYDSHFGGAGLLPALYLAAQAPAGGVVGQHGERSTFVCDVTLPDGTTVEASAEAVKTWRIRNDGPDTWTGWRLVRARIGSSDDAGTLMSPDSVPIPETPPGQCADVTVPLAAPAAPGVAIGLWKAAGPDGRMIFPDPRSGLYVILDVVPAGTEAGGTAASGAGPADAGRGNAEL